MSLFQKALPSVPPLDLKTGIPYLYGPGYNTFSLLELWGISYSQNILFKKAYTLIRFLSQTVHVQV